MAMTMVVTRDVEARYRGFLTSVMLEIAPGVYVSPEMSAGVRDRVWSVLSDWWGALGRGCLVMVWRDKSATGHLKIEVLGDAPKEIVDADGILLVRRGDGGTTPVNDARNNEQVKVAGKKPERRNDNLRQKNT